MQCELLLKILFYIDLKDFCHKDNPIYDQKTLTPSNKFIEAFLRIFYALLQEK